MNNVNQNLAILNDSLARSSTVVEKNREAWAHVKRMDRVIERAHEWIEMHPEISIHELAVSPWNAFIFIWYRKGNNGLATNMVLISMVNYIEWPTVTGAAINFQDQEELIRSF